MKIKQALKNIWNKILDIIFPEDFKCILCGKELSADGYFCDDCLNEKDNMIFNLGNRCEICDTQILPENKICDNCKERKSHHNLYFKKCFCPLNYQSKVRSAILKLKEDNAKYLVKPFAELIFNRLKAEKLQLDIITFVPSHKKTIRRRGYNQAKLLAEHLSTLLNVPCIELLEKNVYTKKQKKLDYNKRQENLKDSMRLLDKEIIKGKNILIVDDVITTCATINTCASLMPKAKNIYATAIARRNLNTNFTKNDQKTLGNM